MYACGVCGVCGVSFLVYKTAALCADCFYYYCRHLQWFKLCLSAPFYGAFLPSLSSSSSHTHSWAPDWLGLCLAQNWFHSISFNWKQRPISDTVSLEVKIIPRDVRLSLCVVCVCVCAGYWSLKFGFFFRPVRDNAESIAFYGGEHLEVKQVSVATIINFPEILTCGCNVINCFFFSQINQRLSDVTANNLKLALVQSFLSLFRHFYYYITWMLPSAIVAPRYFAGEVEFGVVSQVRTPTFPPLSLCLSLSFFFCTCKFSHALFATLRLAWRFTSF